MAFSVETTLRPEYNIFNRLSGRNIGQGEFQTSNKAFFQKNHNIKSRGSS